MIQALISQPHLPLKLNVPIIAKWYLYLQNLKHIEATFCLGSWCSHSESVGIKFCTLPAVRQPVSHNVKQLCIINYGLATAMTNYMTLDENSMSQLPAVLQTDLWCWLTLNFNLMKPIKCLSNIDVNIKMGYICECMLRWNLVLLVTLTDVII